MKRECVYDVVIAGAGPAGMAVAARLAQRGYAKTMLVIDRYRFPRDKPCGGALTGHMDRALATLDLKMRVSAVPCGAAYVRYGQFERRVEMGRAVEVIRRREFDADLVAQVRAMGVDVLEGEGLVSYEVEQGTVSVHTSSGRRLVAKVLVGADGAASRVRKQILRQKKEKPHRLVMCEMNVPVPNGRLSTMVYDFTLMNRGLRGYLWVFPAPDNTLNVGIMHYPSPGNNLGGRSLVALLREGLLDHGLHLPDKGARGWPVWGYHPKASISEPHVLTVGDAAGIDGLTGEGISVAMEQATVAGDAIDFALRAHQFAFSDYRGKIRDAIVGRELSLDRQLSKLVYGSTLWRDWLALVLMDEQVLEMYARRVDGTAVLAHQKMRLFRALGRHSLRWKSRRKQMLRYTGG